MGLGTLTFLFPPGAAAQTTNYRSIGTNGGTLYSTGTATVALSGTTVNFSGTACLPADVGQGDQLTFTGPPAETLYILSRDDHNTVTVQTAATSAHTNQAYTITRAYTTLQAWETGQGGDLVVGNRVEVGVAYDDGAPFTAGVTVDGNTTDSTRYMKLTVAPRHRHNGTAGTGVALDGGPTGLNGNIAVNDDYTVVEWFELLRHRGLNGKASVTVQSATNVLLQHLLVHDFDDVAFTVVGIKGSTSSGFTVRNSIFYDGEGTGASSAVRSDAGPSTATIENCTVYGMARGIYEDVGTYTVRNTIAMGSSVADFDVVNGTQSYNLSSDGTAAGTGSITGKSDANQFASTAAGSEDFHLKPKADALDVGTSLAGSFTNDVDGDGRPGLSSAWDMGADELGTTVYRSIGMNAGTLYSTGDASVAATFTTVDFGAGASLPTNVGTGDVLSFTAPGTTETLYILARLSPTQVVLQTAATSTHTNQTYTITRAYSGAAAFSTWETARNGDLVTANKVEVGVVYADAPFVYNAAGPDDTNPVLTIQGIATSERCYVKLTVPQNQRHRGRAYTGVAPDNGVVLDGSGHTKFAIRITDDHTVVEWLELKGFYTPTSGGAGTVTARGYDILLNGLLAHGFYDATGTSTSGLRTDTGGTSAGLVFTARNCTIYDGNSYGFRVDRCDLSLVIENSTVYNMRGASGRGVGINVATGPDGGAITVTNTISVGNAGADFYNNGGTLTQSYNLSSDTSATGTGSLPSRAAANQFVDDALGTEDLHLKTGADALEAGTDLSASGFRIDIDAQTRPGGPAWDIGADEKDGTTTSVGLLSLEARGSDGGVELSWRTGTELRNLGFHVYRALSGAGPWERVTQSLIEGPGSSALGASYRYLDVGLDDGVEYFYELEDVEETGRTERHGPVWATAGSGGGSSGSWTGGSGGSGTGAPGGSGGGSRSDSPLARTAYGDPGRVSVRELSRGSWGVELELLTGGFYATPRDDGTVSLSVPGFEEAPQPGTPAVPLRRVLVKALAGRGVVLQEARAEQEERFASVRPSLVGTPQIEARRDGTVRAGSRRVKGEWGGRGAYPASWARVAGTAFQGEEKKGVLELYPLRWDGERGELVLAKRMRVRLGFVGRETGEVSLGGSRGRRAVAVSDATSGLVARLATRERGVYGVRYEEVFPGETRVYGTEELRLSRGGEAVSFHVEPPAVGSRVQRRVLGLPTERLERRGEEGFGPGSVLYFVSGGGALNTWGNEAVFELSAGSGLRMEVVSGRAWGPLVSAVERERVWEENRYYLSGLVEAPEVWLWDVVTLGKEKSYTLGVSGLAAGGEGRLGLRLQGASDLELSPDHHVRVSLNGVYVGEASWDGKRARELSVEVGPGVLREGDNVLVVANVGDTGASESVVYLDRVELRYAGTFGSEAGVFEGRAQASGAARIGGMGRGSVVLDTTAAQPRWLRNGRPEPGGLRVWVESGHRYLGVEASQVRRAEVRRPVGSDLRSASRLAEWVLVGPRELLGAAEPLVQWRREQGLAAVSVPLEEVWEEFGHGEGSAEALKGFLSYAYQRWSRPSLRYVVLLGDATYDPKGYLGAPVRERLPGMALRSTYLWTVSDPGYGMVNGEDELPDVSVGRLPVATVEETRSLVEKILAWERGGFGLGGRVTLVADNPDAAGDFEADAEDIAGLMGTGRDVERIRVRELGRDGTRGAVLSALDGGLGLLSYVGHGGVAVWATENVLNSWDVGLLREQSEQPLVVTMNCLNGYFLAPGYDSLSEALLRVEGRGAVAAFSPSGLSVDAPAHAYHRALMGELESGRHERLGDAVLAAQGEYAASGAWPELLRIYHLFGDPALEIR
jgi:hypothetical protein